MGVLGVSLPLREDETYDVVRIPPRERRSLLRGDDVVRRGDDRRQPAREAGEVVT
jgi:hypothetical protein